MSEGDSSENVHDLAREWNEIAEIDPMWAILSRPDKKHSKWSVEEFFATGREEIDEAIALVERSDAELKWDTALDFGCGVGRLSVALSDRFLSVTGVDISSSMIDQARTTWTSKANLSFVVNERSDLSVFSDNSFDFVYSARVLQHMPTPQLALNYIAEFVRVLRPGGVACFQVPAKVKPYRRFVSRRRLAVPLRAIGIPTDWLYRRLGLHSMHLTAVPAPLVEKELQGAGATLNGQTKDPYSEGFNSSFFYVAVKS
jgi:2-polyprenyl-3-methyl-5-hydroxy-6-metoxy-1,4-benzoquinol methylase